MVAKAATKAGEFFCFHCGRQVDRDDIVCRGCGLNFHKVVNAFRCPRCAKILPSGAVVCPACGLGFKIRSIPSTKEKTADEVILVDLIDTGKQPGTPPEVVIQEIPPEQLVGNDTKDVPPPSPDAKADGTNSFFTKLDEAEADLLNTVDRNKRLLEEVKGNEEVADGGAAKSKEEIDALYHRLLSGIEDVERLDSVINRLAYDFKIAISRKETERHTAHDALQPSNQPVGRSEGLSNLALKRLLEEREREVGQLREREADIARREEHINRMVREYAAKKKELETLRHSGSVSVRDASEPRRSVEETIHLSDFPGHLDIEDRDGWLREQARIKDDLLGIRNEMSAQGTGYYQPHIPSELMGKIEVLEERLVDSKRERDELLARLKASEELMNETKAVFMLLDQLLARLPPTVIEEFSKSEDFRRYDRLLDRLNI